MIIIFRYTNFNNIKSIIRKFETLNFQIILTFVICGNQKKYQRNPFSRSKRLPKETKNNELFKLVYRRFVVNASCYERSFFLCCILLNEFFVFLLWIGIWFNKRNHLKDCEKATHKQHTRTNNILPAFGYWEVTWIFIERKRRQKR